MRSNKLGKVIAVWVLIAAASGCASVTEQPRIESPADRVAPTSDSGTDHAAAEYAHRAAREAVLAGDYTVAEQILIAMNKRFPRLSTPYVNLGLVYAHTGRDAEAVAAFRRALELQPRSAPAYNNLGVSLRSLGRVQEAQEAYSRALEIDPDYAYAHLNLGILYDLYLNQPKQAVEHYRRYISLSDDDTTLVKSWIRRLGLEP